MRGTVVRLNPDEGFGFIEAEGRELFFHRGALQGVEWEEIAEGTALVFDVSNDAEGDRGDEHPRAVNVKLAPDAFPTADNEPLPPEKLGARGRT